MNPEDRLKALLAFKEKDPNNALTLYGIAMEYKSAGDTEEAMRAFEELLGKHPNYVAGYFHAALCLQVADRAGEAADWLRRGIEVARTQGDLKAAGEMEQTLDLLE